MGLINIKYSKNCIIIVRVKYVRLQCLKKCV